MKKQTIDENRKCPKCGKTKNQINKGKNHSGTQRCRYFECQIYYTPQPKQNAYDEEMREMAIKTYYAGVSGRGVGKIFGFNKANVYNWIKKKRFK
jgi:transposase-like protein